MASLLNSTKLLLTAAVAFRAILLLYGFWQDTHSAVKYTDIDYLVFTDAARYVSQGASPYDRDTYRYTPLLAWLLLPTTWGGPVFFAFGKILFAAADVLAGWLIVRLLREHYGMSQGRALKYASVWLLNPMVANISTRGSSEGLLCCLVVGLLWAVLTRRITLAGVILGLGVHFKIYPFIYGVSIIWWLDRSKTETEARTSSSSKRGKEGKDNKKTIEQLITSFITPDRIHLSLVALSTFSALNISMYILYGLPFVQHTYLHHVTRIDHRHNFSPYHALLYLSASGDVSSGFESWAFLPQLVLSVVLIPLVLAKKSLVGAMLAQTFAFVSFNKVCTSQYFLWYLIFLPFYLPSSSFMRNPLLGISALSLWVLSQALWLQQGYNLEFLGLSSFLPGMFLAGLFFFAVNAWILGIVVQDVGDVSGVVSGKGKKQVHTK